MSEHGFVIGQRVRATFPNSHWGEGVLVDVKPAGATVPSPDTGRMVLAKPLIVRRDDGKKGYFHYDQIERI
jgi:hypothetical protein